jgi:putative N6-adenine-specific DNA methylase
MSSYQLIATATFGLEAVVRRELEQLGYDNVSVANGKVMFTGTKNDIAKTNLWLRTADRVLLQVGSFHAHTFDQLYEHLRNIKWQEYIPQDGTVIVNASSVKSKLFSLRDIQKIGKKAISDKLMFAYKTSWLQETGPQYDVKITILKDEVSVTLDTSGDGLHKRGYRVQSVEAPLKETLAAALILLSYWSSDRVLYDVFCGSGTIPIEAAMIGRQIAPGLNRDFASKHWPHFIPEEIWKEETRAAYQAMDFDKELQIYASDISEENLNKAIENAEEAGVDDCIQFEVADFKSRSYPHDYGILISNPPYGERLMEEPDIVRLTKDMKQTFGKLSTWSTYILTSFDQFEQLYGKRPDRRRKLYNGRLESWYYQYYGPRPKIDN